MVPLVTDSDVTGGWWHLHWGGQARGNGWSGISGMVSNTSNMVSMCLMPFHLLRFSLQQTPVSDVVLMSLAVIIHTNAFQIVFLL